LLLTMSSGSAMGGQPKNTPKKPAATRATAPSHGSKPTTGKPGKNLAPQAKINPTILQNGTGAGGTTTPTAPPGYDLKQNVPTP
jgi:hypothetical protein